VTLIVPLFCDLCLALLMPSGSIDENEMEVELDAFSQTC
jgi:hypothetical protein